MSDKKTNFFKLDRKIFNSDIWTKPHLLRLFVYLIGQARFSEEPNRKYKDYGIIIERGQYLKSYRALQRDLEYIKNNQLKQYSLSKIKRSVDKLINEDRIKTEKTELGTLFTIVNYCQYQDSYKNNDSLEQGRNRVETGSEQGRNNTKNVEEGKRKEKKDNKPSVPYTEIKELYLDICKSLPSIRKMTDSRRKHLRARWREEKDIEVFKKVFEKAENSDFLTGNNDRNWKATFDWIIKNDTNWNKILEGKYNNKNKKKTGKDWEVI